MEQKKDRSTILTMLILIALVIIIFLLIKSLGLIDHRPRIPTGNIDIFDINFGRNAGCCNCNCNCHNNNNVNTPCGNCVNSNCNVNNNSNNNNNDNSNNGSINNTQIQTGVYVYDSEEQYTTNTPLNIFTQTSYYVVDGKIAPLSENSYQFVIRNNNDFNIRYDIAIMETNEYDINMKYRLKLNGKYVAGNDREYVTADELNQYAIGLASNTYDVYTLDWKWFESSNDTKVGTNIAAYYKLDLKVTAVGY